MMLQSYNKHSKYKLQRYCGVKAIVWLDGA